MGRGREYLFERRDTFAVRQAQVQQDQPGFSLAQPLESIRKEPNPVHIE